MTRKICAYIVGGVALAALSLPLTITPSYAQNEVPPQGQAGPRRQGNQNTPFGRPNGADAPGQGRQGGFGGMMGGGQATMVVSGNFLFILRGNQLLKVDANTLRVVAQGELPGQQMPPNNFRGGNTVPDQGRGGNVPPPPPAK